MHRLLVARVADDDLREPRLQVGQRLGKAEDRHHLGRDDDVEAVLPRIAVRGAAERDRDVAQRAVVHVHDALPRDPPDVQSERVAMVNVVVDQRSEQVVRDADRVKITGEVQVDILHRHDLRVATASGAALHPEHGSQRGLAQADCRLLPDAVERIAQSDGRRRLAFAGGCRAYGRNQDQLAALPVVDACEPVQRDLGFRPAIGFQRGVRDAESRRDLADGQQTCMLRDVDIGLHVRGSSRVIAVVWPSVLRGARQRMTKPCAIRSTLAARSQPDRRRPHRESDGGGRKVRAPQSRMLGNAQTL